MSQADIASMIPGINHVLEAINKVNLDMAFGHTHTPQNKLLSSKMK